MIPVIDAARMTTEDEPGAYTRRLESISAQHAMGLGTPISALAVRHVTARGACWPRNIPKERTVGDE